MRRYPHRSVRGLMPIAISMAVKLYMDHHVPRAITNGLRLRRIDILYRV